MANRTIEIPAGTQIVNVVEILQKVIKQVSPPLPPRGLSVVSLQKRFTLEPKHYRDEDLTDDDCDLLESIKCDSPIAEWFPMSKVQFDELKALFESAPNKPEWGLSAVFRDYYSEAKAAHSMAFSNHLNNIETLVKDGQLNLIQETGDPIKLSNTQGVGFNAFFTVDDARAYLKTCGFELREVNESDEVYEKVDAVRGITKQCVIDAFEGLHFDRGQWSKYLPCPPDWLENCRAGKGRIGDNNNPSTWYPVKIAAALTEVKPLGRHRRITATQLDAVFVSLPEWIDEWKKWKAANEYYR